MATVVEVVAYYHADPDYVFQSALRFSEMTKAMEGIATYSGLPADDVASEGDTIIVDVTFWGVFKQRGHRMFIERLDREARIVQSRENGNGISRWDHTLSVQPAGTMACWTDRVVVDAGWLTPIVARFAAIIYRRRHLHRKAVSLSSRLSRE